MNFPVGEVSVNTADYDHDGDLDIFFTGKPCVMYNNEGDDTFKENLIPNFSAGMNNTQWVDFDSDGDLDLFMTGYFTADYVEDVDQPYGYVTQESVDCFRKRYRKPGSSVLPSTCRLPGHGRASSEVERSTR